MDGDLSLGGNRRGKEKKGLSIDQLKIGLCPPLNGAMLSNTLGRGSGSDRIKNSSRRQCPAAVTGGGRVSTAGKGGGGLFRGRARKNGEEEKGEAMGEDAGPKRERGGVSGSWRSERWQNGDKGKGKEANWIGLQLIKKRGLPSKLDNETWKVFMAGGRQGRGG